jgi:glycosyltransferase involved in cell wall biosynthesis
VKRALSGLEVDVIDISPLRIPNLRPRYVMSRVAYHLGGSYRFELDGATIRAFARQARSAIDRTGPDVVIALSVLPVRDLGSEQPLAVWGDATHANLQATYAEYARLPPWHVRNAANAEDAAMRRAEIMAYASPWAAASAIEDYGAAAARVRVLPFGANLEPELPFDAEYAIATRKRGECQLIWIGADWARKRGGFCVAVAEELDRRGMRVKLTMVGDRPERALPAFVDHLGYLSQRELQSRKQLSAALSSAHFLVLPSRAECFGIVVAEANAHAVPCVAARVGGIPGVVTEHETGILLAPDASPADYADRIEDVLETRDAYAVLAARAHVEHSARLNWTTSCERLLGWLSAAT